MKYTLLLFVAILGIKYNLKAQTNVSGTLTQDTHWTLSGSPYSLTATVGVISGVTLTIDPGVQIVGNYDLLIKGTLLSNGTSSSHIYVQGTRIILKNTNLSSSSLSYLDFDSGGVQLADESEFNQDSPKNSGILTISNCSFGNSSYARTKGYDTGAKLLMNNCIFNSSTVYGYYPRTEIIEINNSSFSNSTIVSDSYNYGIVITNSTISSSSLQMGCCGANFNISGSQITGSSISNGGGSPVNGPISIDNSKITDTSINLPSAMFSITNCSITSSLNTAALITLGDGVLKNSTISGMGTETLLRLTGYNGYNIDGNIDIENVTLDKFNVGIEIDNFSSLTLTSCNFINANQYTIQNLSSKNINAQLNYWGTINDQVIKNQIFDLYDNINYGVVDYSNYLQSPVVINPVTPPTNPFKGLNTQGIFLSWTLSNDSQAVGYNIYKKTGSSYTKIANAGNNNTYASSLLTLKDTIVITSYTSFADGTNDVLEGNESKFSEAANLFFQTYLSSENICSKDTLKISVAKNYNFISDKFIVLQLAGSDGTFNKPYLLDSLNGSSSQLKWIIPDTIKSIEKYKLRLFSRQLSVFTQYDSIAAYRSPTASFNYQILKCPSGSVSVSYVQTNNTTFEWSYGDGVSTNNTSNPFTIVWNSAGPKTIALKVHSNGCTSQLSKTFALTISPKLTAPSICVVTVDSASLKNRVVWKYPTTGVLKFVVYRETDVTNIFTSLGTVTPQTQNSFIDSTSLPDQQAYKYRLSAFDSCEVETDLGTAHKTIHLQISSGGVNKWNLNWTGYEGLDVTSYKIYRWSNNTPYTAIAAVAGDTQSFTDLSPLADYSYYQVQFDAPACSSMSSKSNTAFNRITAIEKVSSVLRIYPNPAKETLFIDTSVNLEEPPFIINDVLGKEVIKGNITANPILIDFLTVGVYFVKVKIGSEWVVQKLIKE